MLADKNVVTAVEFINEKDFAQAVVEYAQALHWTVWRTWRSIHSPAGEPDLRLVRPPRVLFVELKSLKGRITDKQIEAQKLLLCCPGVEVYLWKPDNWPEIETILN